MTSRDRWAGRATTAAQVARLYPLFLALGIGKRVIALGTLARWSWRPSRAAARDRVAERRVISSILRLGAWAGRPDRDCIQRSLLLYRELSRAGANPCLMIGFRREGSRLEGHAWVEADGAPVAEAPARDLGFETMWSFGPKGAIVVAEHASN